MNQNKKFTKRNIFLTVGIVLISVLLASCIWWFFIKSDPIPTSEDGINYGPPTGEEQAQADEQKEDAVKRSELDSQTDNTANSNSSTKKSVSVYISYAEPADNKDIEVSGSVEGIYESGGTCTATMVKGSSKVSVNNGALKDAQTVVCGRIVIPRSKLSAGTWQVVLSYSSKNANGSSESQAVEVK